jgi:hypothetical protein
VLAHVIVALGRTHVVVEGDAGAHDVDQRRTLMLDRCLDQRNELFLVARKAARDERRAQCQRDHGEIDRFVAIDRPALALAAAVGGCRELSLGKAVHAVVLDDVDHVDATAEAVRELAQSDRRRIPVSRHAQIDQVAVG